ncbi:hypothetical protein BGZ63DRAFT_142515 [Mariannaea sp. PMI_226]|nr:hypothetical protein BGZ63DRAFT_142515 [Mariannaea sp. PMI_226]
MQKQRPLATQGGAGEGEGASPKVVTLAKKFRSKKEQASHRLFFTLQLDSFGWVRSVSSFSHSYLPLIPSFLYHYLSKSLSSEHIPSPRLLLPFFFPPPSVFNHQRSWLSLPLSIRPVIHDSEPHRLNLPKSRFTERAKSPLTTKFKTYKDPDTSGWPSASAIPYAILNLSWRRVPSSIHSQRLE